MEEAEKNQREMVVKEALSWLKTAYHHMGRVKYVNDANRGGTDCGMFILEVFERCGLVPHIEVPHYPPDWHLHRSEEKYLGWVRQYAREVSREPLPGDVILYRYGRCISHGAIVIAWPQIIHAYVRRGVILANGLSYTNRQQATYSYWG